MTAMIVAGKLDENRGEKTKKHNKTFSLSPDDVAFLESVDRKSAFLGMLIDGYRKGQFIQAETAELLNKYNKKKNIQRRRGQFCTFTLVPNII